MGIRIQLNDCMLLDEKRGSFNSDDGRTVEYHNARFFDTANKTVFKANIAKSATLPEPTIVKDVVFELQLGEKFTKLVYLDAV